jgi:hypothetical protein
MINPSSIFIWEGKIHLGDEPGIYGNASFSGLSLEYPLTIANIDNQHPQNDTLKLELVTADVNVFPGYPGHKVVIRLYTPNPIPGNPYQWKETIIKDTDRILNSTTPTIVAIPINAQADNTYISIAIEIDTTVKPGLYDDFLLTRLNYRTANDAIFAKLGFE